MVERWTGRETRALRHALRMTVQGFAEHLGVSPRTVSKWESRGSDIVPLPELQAVLDTALQQSDDAARHRFSTLAEVSGRLAPTVAICGSRSGGAAAAVIDEVVPDLARSVLANGWRVNHGPVGVGIEVMTFIADRFRPPDFTMSPSLFGRPNIVRNADLAVVIGGAAGTLDEVQIAIATRVPVLPFVPSGGTARTVYETMRAELDATGLRAAECRTAQEFVRQTELAVGEVECAS